MIGNGTINRRLRAGGQLLAAGLVGLAVITFGNGAVDRRDTAEDQRDTVKGYTLDLADRTLADCSTADKAPDPGTCEKAAEAKTIIEQRIVEVPAARRSDAEIRELIKDVIEEYPELLPRGKDGTTPVVDYDRIVREVQEKIPTPEPGKDGETPVIDYDRVIREVMLQIPVPADGQSPPCLSEPGQCMGESGPPGRGIVSGPFPVRSEEGCVMRTIYDQDPTQVDTPTSELNCLP
jgi:hypothetical protein